MMKAIIVALGVLLATTPAFAVKNGFDENITMGNSGKDAPNTNAEDSNGTKTEKGPKGALKNDNEPDSNVTNTGPGNSQH
jgi:hypothetical protein